MAKRGRPKKIQEDVVFNEKGQALEETITELQKKYGEGVVVRSGSIPCHVEAISTGCYAIDNLLGCGGLPRGRLVEVFGQESSGKSTTCLFFVAQMQKAGGVCVYIDAENAYDESYASAIGVDTQKLIVVQPTTLEEAMDVVRAFVSSGGVDLIVVDSVAALVPKCELEGEEMLKTTVAEQARLMGKALRILSGPIARSKAVVILINQVREKIGVFFGNKETTPGGKALKFYASVRLQVNKGQKIVDKEGTQIGNVVYIKAVKNKVGFPWKEGTYDLYYGSGVDLHADTFCEGLRLGLISKSGNTFFFLEQKLGVGREAAVEYLRKNKEIYHEIRKQIKSSV